MFIKQIILDGFKSYANRTVLDGWDPKFNAITGLNGSGKSNILDAICFVLGISNLSQVRAQDMKDLVYKQGQARVTKAAVTIVFDNSDRSASPPGYENSNEITVTRQIVIGGKNKYLINGQTAQANRVHTLFHSVQLNVNNPHFLIMQGRITKVCNMKEAELLGLIEEAAGTSMYESKRLQALQTLAKKQSKVDEINKILTEEIAGTMEKLSEDRNKYVRWQSLEQQVQRQDRFVVAGRYYTHTHALERLEADAKAAAAEIAECEANKLRAASDIQGMEHAIREKEQTKVSEDVLKKLADANKLVAQHDERRKVVANNLAKAKKAYEDTKKSLAQQERKLSNKETELASLQAALRAAEREHQDCVERIESLQSSELGVGTGKSGGGTLEQQSIDCGRALAEVESKMKEISLRSRHVKSRRDAQAKLLQKERASFDALTAELKAKEDALAKLGGSSASSASSSAQARAKQQAEQKFREAEAAFRRFHDEAGQLQAAIEAKFRTQWWRETFKAEFESRPQEIYGPFGPLVEISEGKGLPGGWELKDVAFALEIAAAGKLYNIVVKDKTASTRLIQNPKLRFRVTNIPLADMKATELTNEQFAMAQRAAGNATVVKAGSLVHVDHIVQPASDFVFGKSVITTTDAAARAIANTGVRAVTLQGDLYDGKGTVTGGSRPMGSDVLEQIYQLRLRHKEMAARREALERLRADLAEFERQDNAGRERDMLEHQINIAKERLQASHYQRLVDEMTAADKELADLATELAELSEEQTRLQKKQTELDRMIKSIQANAANAQAEIKKELKTLQSKLSQLANRRQSADDALKRAQLESGDAESDIKRANEDLEAIADEMKTLQTELENKQTALEEAQEELATIQAVHDEEKGRQDAARESAALLRAKCNETKEFDNKMSLEIKRLSHKQQNLEADRTENQKYVERLMREHPWIAAERSRFNVAGGDYDFSANPVREAEQKLVSLKAERDSLGRSINKRVMSMYEKADQEYTELRKKRSIIEKDKVKIEEVIQELDKKKNDALTTTWREVSLNFGKIFSSLLPGTSARLEATFDEAKSIKGLEMQVAFSGVWKKSLSELSGGQRSLLALSLILALLRFKPAPMYILDEIDAALDLQHTQNIGAMLKEHFSESQFIVVSLKPGMFSNANVLIKTKFVDGVSQIEVKRNV